MEDKVIQTIVMLKFKDLRKGKYIAQGAHASGSFMAQIIKSGRTTTELELKWINESFTKICLYVNTEEDLIDVYNRAIDLNLQVNLITDNGLTEFKGVPTKTCLAIGPDYKSKIDQVTGNLQLF